jgi:RecJ-like exonuclease
MELDLTKLVHFEMTSKTRELVNTGTSLVENVLLEVMVQHADLKKECPTCKGTGEVDEEACETCASSGEVLDSHVWAQYLNDRTAEWNKGGKAKEAVIFDNVLQAFKQVVDALAAAQVQPAAEPVPQEVHDSVTGKTASDLSTHLTEKAQAITDTEALIAQLETELSDAKSHLSKLKR